MIHPTCAHARHPDSLNSGEIYSDTSPSVDLAALRRQITAHRAAMTKASESAACLSDMLSSARRLNDAEFAIGVPELRTLIGMIGDEFNRHLDEALAAALKLQESTA